MIVIELALSSTPPPFVFTCKWRNTGLVVLRDEIQVNGRVPVGSEKIPCHFWQDWFSASSFTDPAVKKTSSEVMTE